MKSLGYVDLAAGTRNANQLRLRAVDNWTTEFRRSDPLRKACPVRILPKPAPLSPPAPNTDASRQPVAVPIGRAVDSMTSAAGAKPGNAQAATSNWGSKPAPFNVSTMFLLTDGRVLAEDEGTDNEGSRNWWVLTPNDHGSYANGTWSPAAQSAKDRVYYASAVLGDGRVVVIGGEYTGHQQSEDTAGEVYDPVKNAWSPIQSPPGWTMVGDAASVLLPDGRLMIGSLQDQRTAIWDPKTDTWSDAGNKLCPSDEESWVLMRDGSVLTVDCNPDRVGQSELWTPGKGWIDAGKMPVNLVEKSSDEIGPGLMLQDGRVFFAGATGHTAIYTPSSTPGTPGTWAAGPDLPKDAHGKQMIAKDAPAVLLPNGHVLVAAAAPGNDEYGDTTSFVDFDPATNRFATASPPPNADKSPFEGRFMQLPSGETLFANGTQTVGILPPGAAPTPLSFSPQITSAPTTARAGTTIEVRGLRLNGQSQTVGYGDDASAATNYPLVRLTDSTSGRVYYARTHDHSTMGVGTGDQPESTRADLPANLPPGTYQLQVVANGIASSAVPLTIA